MLKHHNVERTDHASNGLARSSTCMWLTLIRNNITFNTTDIPSTINRRQRNELTTELQECHRLASRQLEEPTQLQRDETAPWEQLPYECRIDWTREGTEILKQRSLEYIRSQPDDITYYTNGSSDGTRVAAAVVHMEEEIIIRLNDFASVLDAEMTAIRVAR